MKQAHYLKYTLLILPFFCHGQTATNTKRDTIQGLAMVVDTVQVTKLVQIDPSYSNYQYVTEKVLSTVLWPSFSVTEYQIIVDSKGETRPKVSSVKYYRIDNCTEINIKRILLFRQQ